MSMDHEDESSRQKGYRRMRASMHLGMGAIYLVAGSFLIYGQYFGAFEFSKTLSYALGSLMLIYGVFRIWRGWADLRIK